MIAMRPFLNDDSPAVVAIWNEQPPLRGRFAPLTCSLLEQYVLAKPYFDPAGLLIAHRAGRPIGFVHVGCAPGARPGELNQQCGVVCQLLVVPSEDVSATSAQLLAAGEQQLQMWGAVEFLGGGFGIHAPFYLGLYGGCRLPGVLADDRTIQDALRSAGYQEHRHVSIWQRTLADFRPPVDRGTIAFRRQYQVSLQTDDVIGDWGDACAYGWVDRLQFVVASTTTRQRILTLTFWDLEPLASSWGRRAAGLADITCHDSLPDNDLLACALGEAMRQLLDQGMSLVEIQTEPDSAYLVHGCQKLGFSLVDAGHQYRKPATAALHAEQTHDTGENCRPDGWRWISPQKRGGELR